MKGTTSWKLNDELRLSKPDAEFSSVERRLLRTLVHFATEKSFDDIVKAHESSSSDSSKQTKPDLPDDITRKINVIHRWYAIIESNIRSSNYRYSSMIQPRDLTTIKDELRCMITLTKFYPTMSRNGNSIAETIRVMKAYSERNPQILSDSVTSSTFTANLSTATICYTCGGNSMNNSSSNSSSNNNNNNNNNSNNNSNSNNNNNSSSSSSSSSYSSSSSSSSSSTIITTGNNNGNFNSNNNSSSSMSNASVSGGGDTMSIVYNNPDVREGHTNSVDTVIPVANNQSHSNVDGVRLFVTWSVAEIAALKVLVRDPNFKSGKRFDLKKIRTKMISDGFPNRETSYYSQYISKNIMPELKREAQAEQVRQEAVASAERERENQAQEERVAQNRQRLAEVNSHIFLETQVEDIVINTPDMGSSSFSALEDVFYFYGYGLWIEEGSKRGPAIQAATTWLISRLFQRKLTESAIDRNHPIVYRVNFLNAYKSKNKQNNKILDSNVCQKRLTAALQKLPVSYQTAWIAVLGDHTESDIRHSASRYKHKHSSSL